MKQINAFGDAALGWLDLVVARPDAASRFDFTRGGLVTAIAYYFIVIGILVVVDLLVPGLMTYDRLFVALVLNALPLLGVLLVTWMTARYLKLADAFYALAVPATYALTFRVLLGVPLKLIFGTMVEYTLTGILLYMLFRLARDIGKMNAGVSIAFAALSIVALVGLPSALYMLILPTPPAS